MNLKFLYMLFVFTSTATFGADTHSLWEKAESGNLSALETCRNNTEMSLKDAERRLSEGGALHNDGYVKTMTHYLDFSLPCRDEMLYRKIWVFCQLFRYTRDKKIELTTTYWNRANDKIMNIIQPLIDLEDITRVKPPEGSGQLQDVLEGSVELMCNFLCADETILQEKETLFYKLILNSIPSVLSMEEEIRATTNEGKIAAPQNTSDNEVNASCERKNNQPEVQRGQAIKSSLSSGTKRTERRVTFVSPPLK